MKRAKDQLTPRDLSPAFNAAVKKVLAYRPSKNNEGRSRHERQNPKPAL